MAKLSISKEKIFITLMAVFIFAAITSLFAFRSMLTNHELSSVHYRIGNSGKFPEGKPTKATLIAGPFDLHRRYRSMEGPYIQCSFKVGDLIASKQINIPKSMVTYVESGNAMPAMLDTSKSSTKIPGLVSTSSEPRSLLWLKGVKLEVLDENDKVLPTSEFLCHWNLDVNRVFRTQIFAPADWCMSPRMITITQGQSEVYFPEGYAVPVASDEVWNVKFQVANRTTDKHRRVKHRCTMYFIKDSDLANPIIALNWYTPLIYVLTDKNSTAASIYKSNCPSFCGVMPGINAPNNTITGVMKDDQGRALSAHWVVPPGAHRYTTPLGEWADPGFSLKSRTIHAVWSHVHPFCTSLALYKCGENSRKQIFSNSVETKTKPGIEIKSINYLCSKEGIVIEPGAHYELEVTYNNTSGVPQDSMAVAGIFYADTTFARPGWALKSKPGSSGSVESPPTTK